MRCPKETLLLIFALFAAGPQAQAAGNDLSHCLDTFTMLEAGGTVTDKDLKAAQQACLRSQQSSLDSLERKKVEAALVTIGEEQRRH
jgi:hypothetical protein